MDLLKIAEENTEQTSLTPNQKQGAGSRKRELRSGDYEVTGLLANIDFTQREEDGLQKNWFEGLNTRREPRVSEEDDIPSVDKPSKYYDQNSLSDRLRRDTFNLIGDYKSEGSFLQLARDVEHYGTMKAFSIGYGAKDVSIENAKSRTIGTKSIALSARRSEASHMGYESIDNRFNECEADVIGEKASGLKVKDSVACIIGSNSKNTTVSGCQSYRIGHGAESLRVEYSIGKTVGSHATDITIDSAIAYDIKPRSGNNVAINTVADETSYTRLEENGQKCQEEIHELLRDYFGSYDQDQEIYPIHDPDHTYPFNTQTRPNKHPIDYDEGRIRERDVWSNKDGYNRAVHFNQPTWGMLPYTEGDHDRYPFRVEED